MIVGVMVVTMGYCLMKYSDAEWEKIRYNTDEYFSPGGGKWQEGLDQHILFTAIGNWSVNIGYILLLIGIIISIHEGLHLLRREPSPPIPKG